MAIKNKHDFDIFEKHLEDKFQLQEMDVDQLYKFELKNKYSNNFNNLKLEKKHLKKTNNRIYKAIKFILLTSLLTVIFTIGLFIYKDNGNKIKIATSEEVTLPNDEIIDVEAEVVTENNSNLRPALLQLHSFYKNNEIVGTLEIDGISDIFVIPKGENNEFYKRHSLFRESDALGTVYLDCNSSFYDKNFIIYGNSNEGNLFSFIKNYSNYEYFITNNTIYTKDNLYDSTWQIFSYYETDLNGLDIIQTDFLDKQSFYINSMAYLTKSIHKIYDESYIHEDDSLLTLNGICETTNKKYFIHAKLIDRKEFE